jgi:dTDP-glucose 4,6-dehydratase
VRKTDIDEVEQPISESPETSESRQSIRAAALNWLSRFGAQYLVDVASWAFAITVAQILRFELDAGAIAWAQLAVIVAGVAVLQLGIGALTQLYRGRFGHGTFDEVRGVTLTTLLVGAVLAATVLVLGDPLNTPRTVGLISVPIALITMLATRWLKRVTTEARIHPSADAEPTLSFGAGDVGTELARRFTTEPDSAFRPVGFIDNDPAKRNLEAHRVRVQGTLDDLERIVRATGATTIVVAVANADTDLLGRVQCAAAELSLQVKVLPPIEQLLRQGELRSTDLRDLQIEDLLGRPPLDTHVENIAGYLVGRRVLVTGAGGSIGSELCAQIARFKPAELIMLDRDETGLQTTQLGIDGHGLLDTPDVVLADIRDPEALKQIFHDRRPEVVFHAAALKHLPMLEQYPDEGWKTNVLGTRNVLEAARSADVGVFINISTDKAANPTSVLGHSKRLAERLTAWMGRETGKPYLSVRFGNVIGSRGSMLPLFTRLIEEGRPLTVTHPDVTRYFMTIPEACQLVLQAGGIGNTGEVLILDMGEPVRILDIAKRMIAISGKDIEIVFTGLREGEKLHEELFDVFEANERPHHPKISHAQVEALAPLALDFDGWRARTHHAPRAPKPELQPQAQPAGKLVAVKAVAAP